MRVLVTGGAGFIGSNLIDFLMERTDWEIIVLDNLSSGKLENIQEISGFKKKIKFIKGDIRNKEDVEKAIKDCDYVVNLSAQTGVIPSINNPLNDADINILGLITLLEACRKERIKKFIQASSAAPLGEQEMPLDENKIPQPLSPYGASKLAGEGYCSAFSASYKLNTIVLRFSNVYGPKAYHKGSVIAHFIKQILNQERIVIYGDGQQTRDFVQVKDICQAIYLAFTKKLKSSFNLFQVGTGQETSINQLADLLNADFKDHSIIMKEPSHAPQRQGEILRNFSDISKAEKILDYQPQIGLKKGLKETIDWFLKKTL